MLVENIYDDVTLAQGDATTLANSNPGISYTVFELVPIGTAMVELPVTPPASWIEINKPL
jgi:hypothetical protein